MVTLCNATVDDSDFFAAMFEPGVHKAVLTTILVLIELVAVPITFFVVLYQRALPELRKTSLNTLSAYLFASMNVGNQVWNLIVVIRLFAGPFSVGISRFLMQFFLAMTFDHIFTMLAYLAMKYLYAFVYRQAGFSRDDLISSFIICVNLQASLFLLGIFAYLETWPEPLMIAILAGKDPACLPTDSTWLDPYVAMNVLGGVTLILAATLKIKTTLEKRKISPVAKKHPVSGLPALKRAPLMLGLSKSLFLVILLVTFVGVPGLVLGSLGDDVGFILSSQSRALTLAAIYLFNVQIITLIVFPLTVVVTVPKVFSFVMKYMRDS